MTATFMVVLDSSVANVALPHIAGNLSASTDEATWVLTSYLVSNAIMLPATNWIARRIGRKRLLMFSILLFTGASMLCGMAANMPMLILARILQGRAVVECSRWRSPFCWRVFRAGNTARRWRFMAWESWWLR